MEEEGQRSSWAIWIILPVCVVGVVFLTKWFMTNKSAGSGHLTEEYNGIAAQQVEDREPAPKAVSSRVSNRPGAGTGTDMASLIRPIGLEDESAPAARTRDQDEDQEQAEPEAVDPKTAKKNKMFGYTRDAITNAVGKAMNNPTAVAAMLNNKYVIEGFLARDTVRAATASPGALANYLKNPMNASAFLNKPIVQRGLNNPDMLTVVATSGLMSALLDTPGGKALLRDPAALGDVFASNPQLANLIATNPGVLNAVMSNPKTAGVIGQLNLGGGR